MMDNHGTAMNVQPNSAFPASISSHRESAFVLIIEGIDKDDMELVA